jgi:hypothetical protein
MWPWEYIPPKSGCADSWLYQGPHLFAALYRFYKASYWGVGIHIGPNRPVYPKGFRVNFLKLPHHLQENIFQRIWNQGEGFNEIIIKRGHPQLRVDLRFMFLVYSLHKADNFPINKFGYGCWNGGLYTKNEAIFNYGPFDPCSSVNIPDFSDTSLKTADFADFQRLCLNGRKRVTKKYG